MTRTPKQKRRLAWVAAATLGGAALLAGGYAARMRYVDAKLAAGRAEGLAAMAAGDFEPALHKVGAYLQRHPEDPDTLFRYARCRREVEEPNGKHLLEAVALYRHLLSLRPDHLEARRDLLKLYQEGGLNNEAVDTADSILRSVPDDPPALLAKAACLTRLRKFDLAVAAAERHNRLLPRDLEGQTLTLQTMYQQGRRPDELVKRIEGLRGQYPDAPGFDLLQAAAYATAGDLSQARTWASRAAGRSTGEPSFVTSLVLLLDQLGQFDESFGVLQNAAGKAGGHAGVRQQLVGRLAAVGRHREVADQLASLNPADPSADPLLLAHRAAALAALGDRIGAEQVTAALAARKDGAGRTWADVLKALVTPRDQPEYVAGIKACREVLARSPNEPYALSLLGQAYAKIGERELAADAWTRSAEAAPAWPGPLVRLSGLCASLGVREPAIQSARAARLRAPRDPATLTASAAALAVDLRPGGGSAAEAQEILDLAAQIEKGDPKAADHLPAKVRALAAVDRKTDATAAARAAAARDPAPAEFVLLHLAAVCDEAGLGLAGDELRRRSEAAHGSTATLAAARANQWFEAGKPAEGLAVIDAAAARAAKAARPAGGTDPAGPRAWRLTRARYLDRTGDARAAADWVVLADERTEDLEVQAGAIGSPALRADTTFRERAVQRLRKLTDGQGVTWRMASAQLLLDGETDKTQNQLAEAALMLGEVTRITPNMAAAHVMLGTCFRKMGNAAGAIQQFRIASELAPNASAVLLDLASLLKEQGDADGARAYADRVAKDDRAGAAAYRAAAKLLAQLGAPDQALGALDRIPAGEIDAAVDLERATLHRKRGRVAEAEVIVNRLLRKPDVAVVRFAASLYGSQGRRAESEKALALLDALSLKPGEKELAWAGYYADAGDLPAAIEHYRRSAEQAPGVAATWHQLAACQMAARLATDAVATVERTAKTVPNDTGFAALRPPPVLKLLRQAGDDPRLNAVAVVAVRDPEDAARAVGLLGVAFDARADGDPAKAVARLQKLADDNRDFLPAQLELAEAYRAAGRQADALAAVQRALGNFPAAPEPSREAVRLYGAAGRWDDVRAAAAAWKQRAPGEAEAADLAHAQADLAVGRIEPALATLRPHIEAAKAELKVSEANPEAHGELLTAYAVGLAATGRSAEADQLLWPLVGRGGPWRVRWARTALALSDRDAAVSWVDRLAAATPADDPAGRVLLAEAYEQLAEAHQRQAAGTAGTGTAVLAKDLMLLAKADALYAEVGRHPKATPGMLVVAAARAERAGDGAAAEALYRRAVAADPSQWVAKNNLALLLVTRRGDPREAIALAAAAVAAQPGIAALHDTLATARALAKDPAAAAVSMRRAVELEPDAGKWWVRLAGFLVDNNQVDEAGKVVASLDARQLDLKDLTDADRQQLTAVRGRIRAPKARGQAS